MAIFTDMIIYKITNIANGKIYIGQTVRTLEERWKEHCYPNSSCKALQAAIKKYGKQSFKIDMIEQVDTLEDLNKKEVFWIETLKSFGSNGYNLNRGGDGNVSFTHKFESRQRMSKAHTGKVVKDSTKIKISNYQKSNPRSETHKENLLKAIKKPRPESVKMKISNSHLGKKMSEESKKKISASRMGKKLTQDHKTNIKMSLIKSEKAAALKKPIKCLESGLIYGSVSDAARQLNLETTNISKVLNKRRKTTGGLTFEYVSVS